MVEGSGGECAFSCTAVCCCLSPPSRLLSAASERQCSSIQPSTNLCLVTLTCVVRCALAGGHGHSHGGGGHGHSHGLIQCSSFVPLVFLVMGSIPVDSCPFRFLLLFGAQLLASLGRWFNSQSAHQLLLFFFTGKQAVAVTGIRTAAATATRTATAMVRLGALSFPLRRVGDCACA